MLDTKKKYNYLNMIAPPGVLQGAAGAAPPKNQGNREARRTPGGAIMFK